MSLKIITFGCRLNIYESEVIKDFLKDKIPNDKDIIIFNSCAVTKEAERKLRQAIRKVKKENPEVKIGVIGCAVQVNKQVYENMHEIDFILGNKDKMKIENYLKCGCDSCGKEKEQTIVVSDIFELTELNPHLISGFEEKNRAFVQIQTGCDNECTFCITRLARGKSISISSAKIIEQIKKLEENGYDEIVLTGINIVDYGKRLERENINLGKLIREILKKTNIPRIRLSSLDIAGIDIDLINLIKNEPRLMPHLHISLQSGDNIILKRMKRRHSREDVLKFCEEIRKVRPEIVLGADLIAGFPTETEEMHQNTMDLVQKANIILGHIFPYSERPETLAAKMPMINKKIRMRRAGELRELIAKQLEQFKKKLVGTKQKVLVENKNIGRLENYLTVNLNNSYKNRAGEIVEVVYKM
jgi:threonylcarbamoyladenosine tRNA methylthiotransferase MtaB